MTQNKRINKDDLKKHLPSPEVLDRKLVSAKSIDITALPKHII